MNLNDLMPILGNTGIPGFFVIFAVPLFVTPFLAIANFILTLRYAVGTRAWHLGFVGACAIAGYIMIVQTQKNTLAETLAILIPIAVFGQFLWLLHTRGKQKAKIKRI